VVWCNLWAHHYRNDLKCFDDPEEDEVDVQLLPRFILTTKPEYMSSLFQALQDKNVANDAWSLIIKLPTDQKHYNKLLDLSDPNWPVLINSDTVHNFLYTLQVIECLMDDTEEKAEMNRRKQWKRDFIGKNGFNYLLSILMTFEFDSSYFAKSALDSLLKLASFFILGAFTASKPDIYDAVTLVRKESAGEEETIVDEQSPLKDAGEQAGEVEFV
jgi:hypothetical protein